VIENPVAAIRKYTYLWDHVRTDWPYTGIFEDAVERVSQAGQISFGNASAEFEDTEIIDIAQLGASSGLNVKPSQAMSGPR